MTRMTRNSNFVMALAAAFTLFISAGDARAGATDDAALKALEYKFAAAVRAKDVDAVMKSYVPDDSLIVFDVVPPRQFVGAKAYAKDWADIFATFKGPISLEIGDLSVSAEGAMGFGHSIQHLSGTSTKGEPIDMTVRVTDVYRKIKGSWLVVHEHVSVPVDPETGKPDFSSKP